MTRAGSAVEGVDAVVHLAALFRTQDEAATWRANRDGTRNLIAAVKQHEPNDRLIMSSTGNVYNADATRPALETDECSPKAAYEASKVAAEQLLRDSGLTWAVLRLPFVYGEGDGHLASLHALASQSPELVPVKLPDADAGGVDSGGHTLLKYNRSPDRQLAVSCDDANMSRSRQVAMLISVLAAVTVTGCTNDPAAEPNPAVPSHSENGPSRAPSATITTGMPLMRLKPPPVAAGEISRRVLGHKDGHPDNLTIYRRDARAGQEYWIHAACTSTTPGKTLSVEVRSGEPGASGNAMATSEVTCDGTVTVNGLGDLPAEAIVVDLRGDQSDVPSGYAIIAPTSSLSEGK